MTFMRKLVVAVGLLAAALAARTASATEVDVALAGDVGLLSEPALRLDTATQSSRNSRFSFGLAVRLGVGPVLVGVTGETVEAGSEETDFLSGGFLGVRGAPAGIHVEALLESGFHICMKEGPEDYVGSNATTAIVRYVGGRVRFEHTFSFAPAWAVSLSLFARHDVETGKLAPSQTDATYTFGGGTTYGLTVGLSGKLVIQGASPATVGLP